MFKVDIDGEGYVTITDEGYGSWEIISKPDGPLVVEGFGGENHITIHWYSDYHFNYVVITHGSCGSAPKTVERTWNENRYLSPDEFAPVINEMLEGLA
ncbi:MAG: hypothetical protein CL840_16260 [Crocinitomicaceae bacterium]|nr:hypothetical protein [Crocinitomicaceae bacterium]|tara:strand:- start:6863 stop:7156 length:294 start_codon:yes stop_codon:yes gene_type:complete